MSASTPSAITSVSSDLDAFQAEIERLLTEHSAVYRFNEEGSGIFFVEGDYAWRGLPDVGRQLQTKLLRERTRLYSILKILTRHVGPTEQQKLKDGLSTLDGMIEQTRAGRIETTKEAVTRTRSAIAKIRTVLNAAYDSAPGQALFVVDTNALYVNPTLEDWRFDEANIFTLVLVPAVLADLDRHKIEHRNPELREKAQGLIRRIKGYRSRGSLNTGVPLVNGVSTIQSIAIEPSFVDTLPWLSAENDDDRLIAGCYELMLSNPHCSVTLVTADINLQNKAEFARLPFVEPPPVALSSGKRVARKR